jgi:dolichol-phosphate mannosyltransferase
MEISIIIPVYNEEGNIGKLYSVLKEVLENTLKVSYEIIFIDDGSTDTSWQVIERIALENVNVRGFKFSRNYGHQSALRAGLDYSKGKAAISMDADLQHSPEIITEFYNYWKKGYDIVYALRKDTKGAGIFKKASSRMFYSLINWLADIKIESGASDFRLLDRKVVNNIKRLQEYHLFIRGIVSWVGYKSIAVHYVANKRYSGVSKYSFKKMLNLAFNGIMGFSIKPLRIATFIGLIVSVLAFLYIIYAIYSKFVWHIALPGWTSILISVLFLGGIQLLSIGIIGEYIGKLFVEVKKRPKYIINKRTSSTPELS